MGRVKNGLKHIAVKPDTKHEKKKDKNVVREIKVK